MSTLVCDFCHTPDPTWEYPANDFIFPAMAGLPPHHSTGSWLSCDTCHVLIENARWRDLAARSAATFLQRNRLPPSARPEFATQAAISHRLFREHRAGPALPRGRT